ncbi:unnamed protein product [Owenia fusiformis]|uniref:Farnesoic acid O-methyl transferase domain-containing protein n=1 Tax=Owenia fusiformis TaxID=6347 RepID=A0A8J1XUE9_OWEFU|nr:unnamed protein product [Owenia fusiformis]
MWKMTPRNNSCFKVTVMHIYILVLCAVHMSSGKQKMKTCTSEQITKLEKELKAEILATKQAILDEIVKIGEQGTSEPEIKTILTPNNYDFKHTPIDVSGKTFFTFDVKTCHDGHIQLSKTAGNIDKNTYEILLQGWNTVRKTSAIRDSRQGKLEVYHNGQVVYCDATTSFWISWSGGYIEVGRGHVYGRDTFLQWKDPSPHPVNAVQFTSGFGANGTWTVYV